MRKMAAVVPEAGQEWALREEPSADGAGAHTNGTKAQQRGLCSTCDNATGCTFKRDFSTPVLYCEEFDFVASIKLPEQQQMGKTFSRPLAEENPDSRSETLRGLCSNCERRHDCVFPKPEGGVWQCEEYE